MIAVKQNSVCIAEVTVELRFRRGSTRLRRKHGLVFGFLNQPGGPGDLVGDTHVVVMHVGERDIVERVQIETKVKGGQLFGKGAVEPCV